MREHVHTHPPHTVVAVSLFDVPVPANRDGLLRQDFTVRRYKQLETSPETIEQELRPAVCERRQADRRKENNIL